MPTSPGTRAAALGASLSGTAAVAAVGGVTTARRLAWYRTLDRPWWTPPDEVFGTVWGLLYAGQAVSAWLVWREGDDRDEVDVPALSSYAVQLALNAAWTLLFFGLRRPALALLDSLVLLLAITWTVREFSRHHRLAAALLLPYLAWVLFATALTASIWWRNR